MSKVVEAHKHSASHRQELLTSEACGCFSCLRVFGAGEIIAWTDWPAGTPEAEELQVGTTAICPHCGTDAVIGSSSGYPITREFLMAMNRQWFNT